MMAKARIFRSTMGLRVSHQLFVFFGNIFRKPQFEGENPWFPVDVPLNQSCEIKSSRAMIEETKHLDAVMKRSTTANFDIHQAT
jgi:hypothetical protein